MKQVPEWVQNFLNRFRNSEANSETRTTRHPSAFAPYCPAGLGEKAEIREIPYREGTILACALYERNLGLGLMPSPESCPDCRYNPDTIRAKAD